MDLATYAATNGLSIAEAEEVLAAMFPASLPVAYSPDEADEIMEGISPKVLAIMEDLISRGPREGRRSAVGAARTWPLSYTHR